MSTFRSWRRCVLTIAVALATSTARAEMITPDSIPNPPSAVGSAAGTIVDPSNIVANQYTGLGLNFNSFTAISHLNGNSVWVPVFTAGGGKGSIPPQTVGYGGIDAGFVSLGTSNPTIVSSFSVNIVGNQPLSMSVYGVNGVPINNITPVIQSLPGSQVWTFTGLGMSSFSVVPTTMNSSPFGISGVSVTTANTPEPSTLILAGLGALGLATRFGWRRVRRVA